MYNDNKWIWQNICVRYSRDMSFDAFPGDHCFIICHHVKSKSILEEAWDNLIRAGFKYFNIFGQQANLWAETILNKNKQKNQIKLETSKVDRMRMSYDLAMLSKFKAKSINFVISDDEYFTEYLIEDVCDMLSGNSEFTPYDWKKFRDGYEFNYNEKDAVISISEDTLIGFLGKEKRIESIEKAFRLRIFDGKSFYEIWRELPKE